MENKLNIDNLRTFVNALNKLPDEVKNNEVDMKSTDEPFCDTAGCHAGLASLVANYIPKLKSLYLNDHNCDYDFSEWAKTLEKFLGFDEFWLRDWAHANPDLWDNKYGYRMFNAGIAFGQKTYKFTHSVIIDHWTEVLKRVEQLNKKGEI